MHKRVSEIVGVRGGCASCVCDCASPSRTSLRACPNTAVEHVIGEKKNERSGKVLTSPLHGYSRGLCHFRPPVCPCRAARAARSRRHTTYFARKWKDSRSLSPPARSVTVRRRFFFCSIWKAVFLHFRFEPLRNFGFGLECNRKWCKNFPLFFVLLAEGDFQVPLFMGFAYLPRAARRAGAARTWKKWLSMHRRACVRAAAPSRLYFCAFASHLAQDTSC